VVRTETVIKFDLIQCVVQVISKHYCACTAIFCVSRGGVWDIFEPLSKEWTKAERLAKRLLLSRRFSVRVVIVQLNNGR